MFIYVLKHVVQGYDMLYVHLSPRTDLWNFIKLCYVTFYNISDLALRF
jgi:hypothetical protein